MRLAAVHWRNFGIASPAEMRERHAFKQWLEARGAQVSAWMFWWGVRW